MLTTTSYVPFLRVAVVIDFDVATAEYVATIVAPLAVVLKTLTDAPETLVVIVIVPSVATNFPHFSSPSSTL